MQPSELALETPYLKDYIAFTRKAYQLDKIRETSYPALADLTPEVLARNEDTIQNIRLWDARPLLQTYQQTQAIGSTISSIMSGSTITTWRMGITR